MDTDEPRASKDTWTTVGKKPVVKKDKSSEGTGGGIVGSTRAAAMAKAQQNSTTAVKKPEAIRIREEQLKRLAKKTAPLPEIFTRRSESDSNSVDSDAEEQRSSSQREKSAPKKPKATAPEKSKGQSTSLQTSLKKVDHKTLAAEFIKTKEDQNVDASFKYVASFLNDKLKDVPLEKSFYAEDGLVWRYPLSVAPKDLIQLFDTWYSSAPKVLLEGYMEWLITDARSNYLSKQKPIHGTQLIIQYLLSKNPDLISDKNLQDRANDLRTYASRKDDTIRDETLFILWAYGQSGITKFSKGFDVWYKLMAPLLTDRRYTGFIIAYLELLLQNHKKLDLGKINKAEVFLNVFDTLFGRGTIHFHKSTKAKINASYARLRDSLFKDKLGDNAVAYFGQFLMRLGTHQSEYYYELASENLVQCLKTDDKCLDVWRGKHQSGLRESQMLLHYILKHDDDTTKSVRHTDKFSDFLDGVVDFEPDSTGKKEVSASFIEQNGQTVELAKKLQHRIKKENKKSSVKRFFVVIFALAAIVSGEIVYNTPKESYAVAGYKTAKPLAIEYWAVAKPLIITSWDDYVKPFSYWAATESVRLTKIYFQLACDMWTLLKSNLPEVQGVLGQAQTYASHLAGQFGDLCYIGLRKLDHFLVHMPPMSEIFGKIVPILEYVREQVTGGLIYVGNLAGKYWNDWQGK